jgi:group I intron endonuclease
MIINHFGNKKYIKKNMRNSIILLNKILPSQPVTIYNNAETDKLQILSDNKGLSGIYMWTHKESGKLYVGSAVDLSKRISKYYSSLYLKRADNYISKALILHSYSAFSLSILEYIDITDLSKEETRLLILEREQFYLNLAFSVDKPNTYNILKMAGSLLGFKHSEESIAIISKALKGKNLGKLYSPETKAKMSEAKAAENNPMYGKTGETHPMFGKTHSIEAIKKMSEARKGILKTEEHKIKISKSMSKNVFVYSFDLETENVLFKSFNTCIEAAKYFDCSTRNISRYLDKNKLYKNQWILSSFEL